MSWRVFLLFPFWLVSLLPVLSHAAVPPPELRRRLETLFNEQDLMIRNQKSDRSDLAHQEMEFDALKIYERIPLQDDLPGLRADLAASARRHGVQLLDFRVTRRSRKPPPPVPRFLFTDEDPGFRLMDAQLAGIIPFRALVRGGRAQVQRWIRSWPDQQMRITEPEGGSAETAIRARKRDAWWVLARAFRFRDVKFPTLRARDPVELLPAWARGDLPRFAVEQPLLWSLVVRARAISPRARPLYRLREALLLSSARMSYFVARAAQRF